MFTYFKAAEYVASSFLFLLLLSGSLNVSEGCLSATDCLHKTLIWIQRDHTARIQTSANSQITLFHLGAHGVLFLPLPSFSLSPLSQKFPVLVPGNSPGLAAGMVLGRVGVEWSWDLGAAVKPPEMARIWHFLERVRGPALSSEWKQTIQI